MEDLWRTLDGAAASAQQEMTFWTTYERLQQQLTPMDSEVWLEYGHRRSTQQSWTKTAVCAWRPDGPLLRNETQLEFGVHPDAINLLLIVTTVERGLIRIPLSMWPQGGTLTIRPREVWMTR